MHTLVIDLNLAFWPGLVGLVRSAGSDHEYAQRPAAMKAGLHRAALTKLHKGKTSGWNFAVLTCQR